ncbi:MAG: hypothetical protein ACD_75C01880G0002 [uncultured bacterium]|nr:MAG: hypothetical protein ACD_75C01880G0002 [uncultured bacterium]
MTFLRFSLVLLRMFSAATIEPVLTLMMRAFTSIVS